MSMNDPLGDMLTRIRNGQMANKRAIEAPFSKLHENVCAVIKDEGFIREFNVEERENNKKFIVIELKYAEGRGVIRQLDRVSKPGRRVYTIEKIMERDTFMTAETAQDFGLIDAVVEKRPTPEGDS